MCFDWHTGAISDLLPVDVGLGLPRRHGEHLAADASHNLIGAADRGVGFTYLGSQRLSAARKR